MLCVIQYAFFEYAFVYRKKISILYSEGFNRVKCFGGFVIAQMIACILIGILSINEHASEMVILFSVWIIICSMIVLIKRIKIRQVRLWE